MNLELQDKVVLVTGGASGIGEAIVRLLLAEGAQVAIVDRDAARGEKLVQNLTHDGANRACFIETELTEKAQCQRAVDQTVQAFGRLDVLVNNAGHNDSISLNHSPDEFMASLQRNLFHVFAVTHFAREALQSTRGAIVNVSSKVSVTGQGSTSGYAAAKGGINALTREWALALAPHGVRVNCVVPAECATPMYENWFQSQPNPDAVRRAIERLVPLGQRLTTPEEVAAMVVFLASPRASHMTGQIIFVDGGYTHLDRAASHSLPQWTAEPA